MTVLAGMLRASLLRSLTHRYLSTSVSRRNVPSPPEQSKLSAFKEVHKPTERLAPDVRQQGSAPSTSQPEANVSQSTPPNTDNTSINTSDLGHGPQLGKAGERVEVREQGWSDLTALRFRTKTGDLTARAEALASQLRIYVNKVTGYEEIEALKKAVVAQEKRMNNERQISREAKRAYREAASKRAHSQLHINDLLARVSSGEYPHDDLDHLPTIIREGRLLGKAERTAKERVAETEGAVDKEFSRLLQRISERYNGEQIWSNKIQRVYTLGTFASLGLSMLTFVVAILFVEPWKRRGLAATFEEELNKAMERLIAELAKTNSEKASEPTLVREVVREVEKASHEGPAEIRALIEQEYVRRRHLELAVMGAAAFVVGILGTLIFRQ